MIENFTVILGPGGSSVGGWTIHRRGEERCLDPQEIATWPELVEVDYRRHGELMAQGVLEPRGPGGHRMDEELVFYKEQLLPLSVARVRAQTIINANIDDIPKNVKEYPAIPSTKPLARLQPPLGKYQWQFSPDEKAFINRVFGSLEAAFEEDLQARQQARTWLMGRTDITRHRRARSFEEIVLRSSGPYTSAKGLENALKEYGYPYLKERLITPAAYRHLKKLLQAKDRKLAKLRQRRYRATHPPVVLPVEKI